MKPGLALRALLSIVVPAAASLGQLPPDPVPVDDHGTESPAVGRSWPQWGGPNRDFVIADGPSLAPSWPEAGPRRLWQQPLGGGYSQILVDVGSSAVPTSTATLYVTFRRSGDEVVAALDAATGETRWQQAYAATPLPEQSVAFGTGPNATPLLAGGRLVTVGYTGRVYGLDPRSGAVVWSHDLIQDFGAKPQRFGYSAAPIAYRGLAVMLVGGDRYGAIGLDLETGALRWQTPPLDVSYASPIIIRLGGEDQLVFMTSDEIVGVSMADSRVRWRFAHKNQYGINCAGPWWGPDGLMFVSSQADGGGLTLRLAAEEGRISVEEIARNRGMMIFHNNAVRLGDLVYGASGSFLVAANVKTGADAWRVRGFPEANLVVADGKAILLDESGTLTLAALAAEKLTVISQAALLTRPAWTAPTLAGTRLYLRDQEKILALELGAP